VLGEVGFEGVGFLEFAVGPGGEEVAGVVLLSGGGGEEAEGGGLADDEADLLAGHVGLGALFHAERDDAQGAERARGRRGANRQAGSLDAGWRSPAPAPRSAPLCVVPFGMEEGTEADVPGEEIGLVVGEPATFRFFSSATRKQDHPGEPPPRLVRRRTRESVLPSKPTSPSPTRWKKTYVPVHFHSKISELGVFESGASARTTNSQRWKLEFSVREDAER